MAYVAATKPTVGEATKKTLVDAIIDNQTYFNSVIGTNAAGISLVPNGSFEDITAGVPDGWTETEHSAGTGSVDTATPAHGETAYKFVSAGAPGGGYLETTDSFNVTPGKPLTVHLMLKSSVVDIHNLVQLRWYTEADAFVSMVACYDDEVANPTAWSPIIRTIIPPPTARKAFLRLTGADNDNVTPGTCTFDAVSVKEQSDAFTPEDAAITAAATSSTSWASIGTETVVFPTLSATCVIRCTIISYCGQNGGTLGQLKFGIGNFESNVIEETANTPLTSAHLHSQTLIIKTLSGSQTLTMYGRATGGGETVWGQLLTGDFYYEILRS